MRAVGETVDLKDIDAFKPAELIDLLREAEQSCIHISCHGRYYKNFKKHRRTGLILKDGRLFADEICSLKDKDMPIWEERKDYENVNIPQFIFLSACETAKAPDLAERLMQAGVRYVVAPREETAFSDAALFSSSFYPLLFVEQKNPYEAFKTVKRAFPTMTGKWEFYGRKKHKFKIYERALAYVE